MDNQRLILFFSLSFVLLLLWQAWQDDYNTVVEPVAQQSTQVQISSQDIPLDDLPTIQANVDVDAPLVPAQTLVLGKEILKSSQRVSVITDVLGLEIDTTGGDIRIADLLKYPVSSVKKDKPFRLMEDKSLRIFIAQSGLLSDSDAPDHHSVYSVEQTQYVMRDGVDKLDVTLSWQAPNGIKVDKIYTFHRGSYVIDVSHVVTNQGANPWRGYQYRQLQRTEPGGSETSMFIYTYTGGVIYSEEEKYEKYKFDDMTDENLARSIKDGWMAVIEHYFLSAWLPDKGETNNYYSKAPENRPYVLGMVSPERVIEAGETQTFHSQLYIGPKDHDALKAAAPGLELTVDFGILTVLADPLFWLLRTIHNAIGNWGWSIILVTLMIKLVFYKLSAASYKSMARMRRLQPKMTALRERHGDDRQAMSKGMMDLYKKEKVNPMGGCLPMMVQIPVFISLYWVLLESVELRQAEFIFWIVDLSIKDPYYVLPLLMGIGMFIQQKLNPAPPDPIQAKIMMALPFIFTFFFAFFPSGLVLYWVVNSMLSIAQQWYITQKIEKSYKSA